MRKKVYVMLGRTGDIINLLPAIEYEARENDYKPILVVSKDYEDVLEGADYLNRISLPIDFRDLPQALYHARNKFPDWEIVNCAVYGKNYHYKRECKNFQRESWHKSGCPVPWGRLPLNFPVRNKEREQKLFKDLFLEGNRKLILMALSGASSPFSYGNELYNKIVEQLFLDDFEIVDISDTRAERIYDLLGLYEKAHCLIAIDSAPLHLAHAVPQLPVISLISDLKDKWHQSEWRPNHILRVLYSEVEHKLDTIVEAARAGYEYPQRKIHYISSMKHGPRSDTQRRVGFAQNTIRDEYNFTMAPPNTRWTIDYHSEGLPKVESLIDRYAIVFDDGEIIMICNADISFTPGITGWILHEVERHGAAYFHRHDFDRLDEPLISEAQVSKGKWYPGSDAFVFTKRWWLNNRDIFPDMYFARECWDMVFRNMVKRSGGVEIHNAIYHEKHKSFWEAPENRNCAENVHNRDLANKWIEKYGGNWNDWKAAKLRYK